MTKKEKSILEAIAFNKRAIKKYKKDNRLEFYNRGEKVHFKQVEFHKCLKRNRWVFGGNRCGKTECGAAEAAWILRGNHPYRENRQDAVGWSVSLSLSVQREVAQKKILQYLNPEWIVDTGMVKGKNGDPAGGIIDYIAVKNVFGGVSRLYFKSCEMGRDKFQGASVDFVWFDEEPPEDIYEECRMRILDSKGDIFGTMTPLLGLTFVYNKIYLNETGDSECWHIFMEWDDNPYLDKAEIKRLSDILDESQIQARKYGRFSSNSGLVYTEFNENVHVIKPFDIPDYWQDKLSIDPGLNNPLSCHWYAVDGDGTVFVVAEHYEAGKDINYHCDAIKRISAHLGWHTGFNGKINALIDSAANQKTLAYSKSVAELFYENDIAVNSNINKEIFSGIARVKSYLIGENGNPRIYIFDTCKNLIREIKGYWWGNDDVPKKRDDHSLDELRYYIMSRPQPSEPEKEKSELVKFKEKLCRKKRRSV